jgi:hypothetical protein
MSKIKRSTRDEPKQLFSPFQSSTAIQEGKEMGQAAETLLQMKQPTQQDEDEAVRELMELVNTCPTGGPTGGRKRRGGAGKRGFNEVDAATTTEVPSAPPASTLPTTGFFSMGPPPKKGEPATKKSRTSVASGVMAEKTAGFVDATRDLAGAVVADNLFAAAGVATVSIINPSAAGQALALLKTGAGGLLGCVTPTLVTALIVGFGLMKVIGPYISFSDIKIGTSITLDTLKKISDRIGNYLEQQKAMSKKAKQLEELNTLKSLHKELMKKIEDIKNNKASTEEAEAATLSTLTQEVKTTTDTPMESSVGFNPAPPTGPLNAGRKTKKRSMKKMKKTRRGIRKPLFKY